MATNDQIEVYRQRYETFRHLDKLRWQMCQIAVAAGSLVLAFGRTSSADPDWWVLAIVGLLLVIFGFVMERIRHGITVNGRALRQAGDAVGDTNIPEAGKWWKHVSFWIAFTIIVMGLVCLWSAWNLL